MLGHALLLQKDDQNKMNVRLTFRFLVRFRHKSECLSLEWFRSRAEAKALIETWRSITMRCGALQSRLPDTGGICSADQATTCGSSPGDGVEPTRSTPSHHRLARGI
jgi:hypothetical protein